MILQEYSVCDSCFSLGITSIDCVCSYTNYRVINLQFETCEHCGSLLNDGNPADTEYNKIQIEKHNKNKLNGQNN